LHVLVVNFDRTLLSAYRAKLNGGELSGEIDFRPRISLMTPEGASFWRYLSFVWSEVSRGSTLLRSPVIASEIEDSLMAMFLYASSSDSPSRTPSKVSSIDRAYLNRAEDYMLAHLSDSVSVADIAEVAGVNARTLARAFKKRYGMGPIGILKERRLEAAQRALLAASPEATTVTEIASSLGFFHLGQFSADYHKAFQELPSETLHR
jgi:AraC-like DNA-binding protein